MEPPVRSDLGCKSQESEFTGEHTFPFCVTQSKESPDPTGCWSGEEGPRPVNDDAHTTRVSIYSKILALSQTRLVPENWY